MRKDVLIFEDITISEPPPMVIDFDVVDINVYRLFPQKVLSSLI
jgi:hypothetical protein